MVNINEFGWFSRDALVWMTSGIAGVLFLSLFIFRPVRKFIVSKIFKLHYPDKRDVEQNRDVYTALVELRVMVDSDRASVLRFHNGSEFLPSSPIWKVTCTHECVKHGVTYESGRLQNVLVSRIPGLIDPVIVGVSNTNGVYVMECPKCPFRNKCIKENKRVVMIKVDELDGTYGKFLLDSKNVKTLFLAGMVKGDSVFGILAVDFCGTKLTDPDKIEMAKVRTCQEAERIQYLLQYKHVPYEGIALVNR